MPETVLRRIKPIFIEENMKKTVCIENVERKNVEW
jgi:hypothetical protein